MLKLEQESSLYQGIRVFCKGSALKTYYNYVAVVIVKECKDYIDFFFFNCSIMKLYSDFIFANVNSLYNSRQFNTLYI